MAKKVIRLTEADIEKMVQKVLAEQAMNDTEVLNDLNDRIQLFIRQKQNEIFNNSASITLVREGNNVESLYVVITNKDGKITYRKAPNSQGIIPINGAFVIGNEKLSDYYEEIVGNNSNFKKLISKHPEIKQQMDEMIIKVGIRPITGAGRPSFIINYRNNNGKNRKEYEGRGIYVNPGESVPMGNVFNNQHFAGRINKKILGIVEIGAMELALGRVGLVNFSNEKTKSDDLASENIKLDLVDVFEFDTIDMKDPSGYEQVLKKFKSDLNNGLTGLKNFKDFLESQNLVVKGFASRDNDPTEQVQGKFSGCKGYGDGSRGQYNLCLSEKRAEKVAQDLQEIFDSLKVNVNIKSKGFGETSKFGPAWTKENPTKPEDTQGNRRVTFNIPKYSEQK